MTDIILHRLCDSIPVNMPRRYYTWGVIASSAMRAVLTGGQADRAPLRLWFVGNSALIPSHLSTIVTSCHDPCLQSDTSGPLKAAPGLGLDPAKGFNQQALNPQQEQVCRHAAAILQLRCALQHAWQARQMCTYNASYGSCSAVGAQVGFTHHSFMAWLAQALSFRSTSRGEHKPNPAALTCKSCVPSRPSSCRHRSLGTVLCILLCHRAGGNKNTALNPRPYTLLLLLLLHVQGAGKRLCSCPGLHQCLLRPYCGQQGPAIWLGLC